MALQFNLYSNLLLSSDYGLFFLVIAPKGLKYHKATFFFTFLTFFLATVIMRKSSNRLKMIFFSHCSLRTHSHVPIHVDVRKFDVTFYLKYLTRTHMNILFLIKVKTLEHKK